MLKLIDLLMVCNDSMTVNVYDNDCELISRYDGRDSIEQELNNRFVSWIYPVSDNHLNIGLEGR